jgi:hypothetical protein
VRLFQLIARRKLDKMIDLTKQSESGVIILNDALFKELAHQNPRPYYLFLSFTSLGKTFPCALCVQYHSGFKNLAQAYRRKYWITNAEKQRELLEAGDSGAAESNADDKSTSASSLTSSKVSKSGNSEPSALEASEIEALKKSISVVYNNGKFSASAKADEFDMPIFFAIIDFENSKG